MILCVDNGVHEDRFGELGAEHELATIRLNLPVLNFVTSVLIKGRCWRSVRDESFEITSRTSACEILDEVNSLK